MEILYETIKQAERQVCKQQQIEVPARLLNRRGSYQRITRTVIVGGTVLMREHRYDDKDPIDTLHWYGKCSYDGRILLVVMHHNEQPNTNNWRAIQWHE